MLPREGDGRDRDSCSLCRIRCTSLGIFCTESLIFRRGCDRTLRPIWVGGPFPARLIASFNPARPLTAHLAGECPLYARAIDILGLRLQAQQLLPCPSSFVQIRSFLNP